MESSGAKFCNIQARDVCVVGAARTPIGSFNGSLSSLSATRLGSIAIEAALIRADVQRDLVEEVFFGNVLNANLGQAPARQAALGAGLPNSVICTTINKVCASGMKALMLGAMSIQSGENNVLIVGGMESMSNAPYYLPKARQGYHLGDGEVIDGMMKDGLWDVYNNFEMGICAELCAEQYAISREEQDDYAFQSYQRAVAAAFSGAFSWEMVPVEIAGSKGQSSVIINKDEGIDKLDVDKFRRLQPAFKKNGSVTAGSASKISDGAAALVLVSGEKALELGLHVICRLVGFADAAQAPELFTTSPSLAIPKALARAGISPSQVDCYEINEAFAVVALANQNLLSLKPETVNVHGGAISLGHPLGCSGARIIVTLLGALMRREGRFGVAAVCNGGGGASAVVVEVIQGESNRSML